MVSFSHLVVNLHFIGDVIVTHIEWSDVPGTNTPVRAAFTQ